jgi:hypothetical protein
MGTGKNTRAHGTGWMLLGGLALTLGISACNEAGTTGEPAPTTTTTTASATETAPATNTGDALVRLSNAQYDNAVKELLGVTGQAEATFPADSLMGDTHFAQYFDAADAVGEQVFANPALASRVLTCTPSEDTACTRQIVTQFASRAYRGPIAATDVDRLTKVATDAIALGETPVGSIKQVVKTVLASPEFIYSVGPASL